MLALCFLVSAQLGAQHPKVELRPEKLRVAIGERVKFTVIPNPALPGIVYQFLREDGSVLRDFSPEPEISEVFWTSGRHTIFALVRAHGVSGQWRESGAVYAEPIDLIVPNLIVAGEPFIASTSNTVATNPNYRFRYGGQATDWSSRPAQELTFAEPGEYSVAVDAQWKTGDAANPIATASSAPQVVQVAARVPTLTLTALAGRRFVGSEIKFVVATTPANAPGKLSFNAGGGRANWALEARQVSYTYERPGTYTATVEFDGTAVKAETTVEIVEAPSPTLTVAPLAVEIGDLVTFTAVYTAAEERTRYGFDFGEGAQLDFDEAARATHRYQQPGKYSVTVQAAVGLSDAVMPLQKSAEVTVEVRPPLEIIPRVMTLTPRANRPVEFFIRTNRPDLDAEYTIDFGDGSPQFPTRSPRFAHTFARAGTFPVAVSATAGRFTVPAALSVEVGSVPWTIILVVAGAVAVLSALGAHAWAGSHPTFRLHMNPPSVVVKRSGESLVQLDVRLNRNVGHGRQQLAARVPPLLRSVRRTKS